MTFGRAVGMSDEESVVGGSKSAKSIVDDLRKRVSALPGLGNASQRRFGADREEARYSLTQWLLTIFGGTILAHYIAGAVVACCADSVESQREGLDFLADILRTVIPALTGLIGAATAFYFSSGRDRS